LPKILVDRNPALGFGRFAAFALGWDQISYDKIGSVDKLGLGTAGVLAGSLSRLQRFVS
jgi:hypothetical protein